MVCLFFFKQKTAYELRISDWSSDVCSSDLLVAMLELVERGGIDQVLADTSSRIARNQGDAHHIRDRINFAGARIFTLADGEINALTGGRSEEHTSELQSLMRISYAVFCLKKKINHTTTTIKNHKNTLHNTH